MTTDVVSESKEQRGLALLLLVIKCKSDARNIL